MRVSQFPLTTLKETPADAEVVSHRLMLRAGLIRRLASGLYTWTPLGLRVLRKVENIVRSEMDAVGALELSMPTVQPAELWQASGRWEQYGPELLRFKDRHQRNFCYGPTHEEVITDFVRREVSSYKHLPLTYYQIQNKFRDEIRPRFGVMRAREFLMKDAYSFHVNQDSLQQTYDTMYQTYTNIFSRMQLDFRPVLADTGSIGGNASHEFHVLARSGEDAIAFSDSGDYAANVELAEARAPAVERPAPAAQMQLLDTPDIKTIEEVRAHLKTEAKQIVKTLIVHGTEYDLVALVLRGDHQLNVLKAEKLEAVASPLTFATAEEVRAAVACDVGSIGPLEIGIPLIADRAVVLLADFICGANEDGKHLAGVNWGRDLPVPEHIADLRNVVEGDPSPNGQGVLTIKRGIEVGHIFQLGNKYSTAMGATVLNEQGKPVVMTMGCYGIGVSRVVAAAIEQNHDDRGIIWPLPIAPFQLALLPMNMHKSQRLREAVEDLYAELRTAGIEVLFDDRKARPGVMFADMELIGIPYRLVVSERGLDRGQLEFKGRTDSESEDIPLDGMVDFIKARIQG